VTRTLSVWRRKPRTRRDRMLARLHAVGTREDASVGRLRRNRRRRTSRLRAQELFRQLGHLLHREGAEPARGPRRRLARPHHGR